MSIKEINDVLNERERFRNKSHCWHLDYRENDVLPEFSRIQLRRERYWDNACDHSEETYVGSARFTEYCYVNGKREAEERFIDVYVFHEEFANTQDVCIRYGHEGPDYISPGTVLDLLITAQKDRHAEGDDYSAAACVINHYMEIRATLRD